VAYFSRNHTELWFETIGAFDGSNPLITLINGHGRSSSDFRLMAKFLFENGISVLLVDNRAAGQTKTEGEVFSIEDMAEDVAALWNHVGVKRTALLGISMGGVIAQRLAECHASKVSKLILVSTCFSPASVQSNRDPWPSDIELIAARLAPNFSSVFRAKNKLLIQAMAKNISTQVLSGSFAVDSARQRRAMDAYRPAVPQQSKSLTTLILHGTCDEVINVTSARELATLYQNSRLDLIEDVGHLLIAECPKVLYQKVADFVRE